MSEALITSQQTYNGTSYATITGLAITPGAGTYLCVFTGNIGSETGSVFHYVALAVDGTEEADTIREHYNESSIADPGCPVEMMTHKVITVGAGEEIQARWRSSASTLMEIEEGNLTLISVQTGDTDQVTGTADDSGITTTPTQLDGMLFADPSSGDYLALFTASGESGTIDATIHVAIYVGGVEVAHSRRSYFLESSLTATTSWCLSTMAKVSPNGSQDVQAYAWVTSGSAGEIHQRTFSLLGNRTILEVSGTASDTEATSGTDKALDDLTHTNPTAGDYMALGSLNSTYGSIGALEITSPSIYEETTFLTSSRRNYVWNDSLDNMVRPLPVCGKVTPNGSEDVSLQWRGSTTSQRTATQRTFLLLQDGVAVSREQEGFRFRDDDGDEDEATWLATQETNINRGTEQTTRLRILTDTADADPPTEGLQLEYKRVADAATEWRKVPLT